MADTYIINGEEYTLLPDEAPETPEDKQIKYAQDLLSQVIVDKTLELPWYEQLNRDYNPFASPTPLRTDNRMSPSDFEYLASQLLPIEQKESTLAGDLKRGYSLAGTSLLDKYAGAAGILGEVSKATIGDVGLTDYSNKLRKATNELKRSNAFYDGEPTGGITEQLPQLGGDLALTIATGGSSGLLPAMISSGSSIASQKFTDILNNPEFQGDEGDAAKTAVTSGVGQASLNALSLGSISKGKVLPSIGLEAITNAIQGFIDKAIDEKTTDITYSPEDYKRGFVGDLILGGTIGGVSSAGAKIADKFAGKIGSIKPKKTKSIEESLEEAIRDLESTIQIPVAAGKSSTNNPEIEEIRKQIMREVQEDIKANAPIDIENLSATLDRIRASGTPLPNEFSPWIRDVYDATTPIDLPPIEVGEGNIQQARIGYDNTPRLEQSAPLKALPDNNIIFAEPPTGGVKDVMSFEKGMTPERLAELANQYSQNQSPRHLTPDQEIQLIEERVRSAYEKLGIPQPDNVKALPYQNVATPEVSPEQRSVADYLTQRQQAIADPTSFSVEGNRDRLIEQYLQNQSSRVPRETERNLRNLYADQLINFDESSLPPRDIELYRDLLENRNFSNRIGNYPKIAVPPITNTEYLRDRLLSGEARKRIQEILRESERLSTPPIKTPIQKSFRDSFSESTETKGRVIKKKNSERGSLDLSPLIKPIEEAKQKIASLFEKPVGEEVRRPEIDNIFRGLPLLQQKVSKFSAIAKNYGDLPGAKGLNTTEAAKNDLIAERAQVVFDAQKNLEDFYRLDSKEKERVAKYASEIRRLDDSRKQAAQLKLDKFDAENPELTPALEQQRKEIINSATLNLNQEIMKKAGLSDRESTALMKVFDWTYAEAPKLMQKAKVFELLRNRGIREPSQAIYGRAASGDAEAIKQIDLFNRGAEKAAIDAASFTSDIKDWNGVRQWFVPFSREGEKFVQTLDSNGNQTGFYLATKKNLAALTKKLQSEGHTVRYGDLRKTQSAAYDYLPFSVSKKYSGDGSGLSSELDPIGFSEHLTKANLTIGEDADLARALGKYIEQLSNYTASSKAKYNFDKALEETDTKSPLYTFLRKEHDSVLANTGFSTQFSKIGTLMYLSGKTSAVVLNMTQPLRTTFPRVGTGTFIKAGNLLRKYKFSDTAEFAKQNPQLNAILLDLQRNGELASSISEAMDSHNALYSSPVERITNAGMAGFDMVETFNRQHAAIAGYLDAQKKKIPPSDIYSYVRDFVRDTQFSNKRELAPQAFRGGQGTASELIRSAYLFKSFGDDYLRFLKNNLKRGDYGAAAKSLGISIALSGMVGVPFANYIIKGLETAGYDPKKDFREFVDNLTDKDGAPNELVADMMKRLPDAAIYGIPNLFGWNISGSTNVNAALPNVDANVESGILNYLLGIPYDLAFNRPRKLLDAIDKGDMFRAAEAVLPDAIRKPFSAIREYTQGLKNPDGTPVGYPDQEPGKLPHAYQPSITETIGRGLGFYPTEYSKRYEAQQTIKTQLSRARENDDINNRLARVLSDIVDGKATKEDFKNMMVDYIKKDNKKEPQYRNPINEAAIEASFMKQRGIPPIPKKMRKEFKETIDSYANQ